MVAIVLVWFSYIPGARSSPPDPPLSSPVDYNRGNNDMDPRAWLASAYGVFLSNVAVWALSRYGFEKDWAMISRSTVLDNFHNGFGFDTDSFLANGVGHPYHGSIYFQAGRAAGLSFAPSALITFAGSLQWELFMENTRPSINDLVNTTLAGIALGEMTVRLANLVVDDDSEGWSRVFRELTSTAMAPTYGLGRGVQGRWFYQGPSPERPPFGFALESGPYVSGGRDWPTELSGLIALRAAYDDVANVRGDVPFEHFSIAADVAAAPWLESSRLDAEGELWGARVSLASSRDTLVAATMGYDLVRSRAIKFSGAEVGAGIYLTERARRSRRLDVHARLLYLPIGSISPETPFQDGMRDYSFGTGAIAKLLVEYRSKPARLFVDLDQAWLHVLDGPPGNEFASISRAGAEVSLGAGFHLSGVVDETTRRHPFASVFGSSNALIGAQALIGWSGEWRGTTSGNR